VRKLSVSENDECKICVSVTVLAYETDTHTLNIRIYIGYLRVFGCLSSYEGCFFQAVKASYVVTCGGLQSDKLAQMSGGKVDPKIIPFRGEYLLLNPKKQHMIKGNIYPVSAMCEALMDANI
jgi:hypothetical protein